MTRRKKQSKSLLAPLAENFMNRVSTTDARLRRKTVKYSLWALALLLCYSFMSGTYGIPRIIRLHMEKSSLQAANLNMTAELIDANRIQRLLKYDRAYIENIARTRHFMVYPGEKVYRFRGQ